MTQARTYSPGIVTQPQSHSHWQRGVNTLVDAIAPTLGPFPRFVALHAGIPNEPPELLDSGGLIARRIYALSQRTEDVGAMHLRQVLWRLHEEVGDGTATAAVLFRSIYNQGLRYIAAGGNPIRLRHYLEEALIVVMDALDQQAVSVETRDELKHVALSACDDSDIADELASVFADIGSFGRLEVRGGKTRETYHEYVEGAYWDAGLHSHDFIVDKVEFRTRLENARILVSDLVLEDPHAISPTLKAFARAGVTRLVVMADKVSEQVLALFHQLNRDTERFHIIAVKVPGKTQTWERRNALEDVAVLTGARPLLAAAGESIDHVLVDDLGSAGVIWADRAYIGVVEGGGLYAQEHLDALVTSFRRVEETEQRNQLRERIGRFLGASATLWVGGATSTEIDRRKKLAVQAAATVRSALFEGAVVGGGMALINCREKVLERCSQADDADERAAYGILAAALLEPFKTLLANAGYSPSSTLAKLNGAKAGFDLHTGQIVDMAGQGILDARHTVCSALVAAVRGVSQALTVEVVVHHRKPEQVINP